LIERFPMLVYGFNRLIYKEIKMKNLCMILFLLMSINTFASSTISIETKNLKSIYHIIIKDAHFFTKLEAKTTPYNMIQSSDVTGGSKIAHYSGSKFDRRGIQFETHEDFNDGLYSVEIYGIDPESKSLVQARILLAIRNGVIVYSDLQKSDGNSNFSSPREDFHYHLDFSVNGERLDWQF